MVTQREMAEAYVVSIEQRANELINEGLRLQKHAKECREVLEPEQEDNKEE